MAGDRAHAPWSVAVDPMVDGRPDPGVLRSVLQLCGDGSTVHLVGPRAALEALVDEVATAPVTFVLHEAVGSILEGEDALVVRGRPGLPVRVALDLLANGDVEAVRSAASIDVVLTAALFRLGRRRAVDSSERGRVIGAARPGVAVDVELGFGALRIVDAGHADRATATDVLGRMLAAAGPSARLGVLDPTGRRGGLTHDVLVLARSCGVDVRPVTATEALQGTVDVVGCTPDTGAVMLQVLTTNGSRTTGLGHVIGVAGDVAAVLPSAVLSSTNPSSSSPVTAVGVS